MSLHATKKRLAPRSTALKVTEHLSTGTHLADHDSREHHVLQVRVNDFRHLANEPAQRVQLCLVLSLKELQREDGRRLGDDMKQVEH